MGILSWMLLGLAAGALAKFILPGRDPGGFIVTILVGIAGAVLGGFVASTFGLGSITGFDLHSLAIAVGGAFVLLLGYRLIFSARKQE